MSKSIKFENFSVSGIYREYAGFVLKIPGHSIGAQAVVAEVPDELVDNIKQFLASRHPAVVVTDMPQQDDVTESLAVVVDMPVAEKQLEVAAADIQEVQAVTASEPEQESFAAELETVATRDKPIKNLRGGKAA